MEREKSTVAEKVPPSETKLKSSRKSAEGDQPRGVIAEWTVTIILLLFGTTTLVQAFVIPTGSMEDTLLVGDHLLVDKLAYAPAGKVTGNILPYSDVKRGDIIVFRYPVDIRQTYVKRAMGVPGDRLHLENKKLYLNGHVLEEPYVVHKTEYIDSYRDNFPADPNVPLAPSAQAMLEKNIVNKELVVPPWLHFRYGRQSRLLLGQPLLGLRASRKHHRQAAGHLLVLCRVHRRPLESRHWHRPHSRFGTALLHQKRVGSER